MKKSLLTGLFLLGSLSSYAQYQLPNGDFEGGTTSYNEHGNSVPNNWNWFDTAEGGKLGGIAISPGKTTVNVLSYEDDPDNHYVKVVEGYFLKNVNGNLTTGMIVASDMDAGNAAKNYNYSDPANGVGQKFSGKPDAVSFKYQVYKKSSDRVAQLNIVVHGKGRYQDPENGVDYSNIVWGKATFQSGSTDGWQPAQVDFVLGSKAQGITPAAVLASLSTDEDAGAGNKGDYIALDDLVFVYKSELKSLSYEGKEFTSISEDQTIDLTGNVYDEATLDKGLVLTGNGAYTEKMYNKKTGLLTLTVKGNDWEVNNANQHVYKVQFTPVPPAASEVVDTYKRLVKVRLGSEEAEAVSSINNITLSESSDQPGTVDFTMNNFAFGGSSMGDVVVKGAELSYGEGDDIKITTSEPQRITLCPEGASEDQYITADVSLDATVSSTKDLTAKVTIQWVVSEVPIMNIWAEVGAIPFNITLDGKTLKVTGSVAADEAAAVIPTDANAPADAPVNVNVVDLTEAALTGDITTETFGAKNPNTLFYAAEGATLTGNNVVKGTKCETLVLTDGLTFNAPEVFDAAKVTFNRKFTAGQLSTVVLPFSFNVANVNGTVYKLESVDDGVLSFKSVNGTAEANVPYLVQTEGDNLFKTETPKNVTVALTPKTVENKIEGTGVTHVGNFGETMKIASDEQTSWYGYTSEGKFVKVSDGTIKPFRTAINSTSATTQNSFALKLDGTVTGILNLENPNAKVDVYTVSGVCVRKNVPAASALNGLSRGVYIVGGQKVVK